MVTITTSKHVFIPIGIQCSGKTTLGRKWFSPHEIWGADRIREQLVGTLLYTSKIDAAAFDVLYKILEVQAKNEVTLYVDNVNLSERAKLHSLFRRYGYTIHHIVMIDSYDVELCIERSRHRNNKIHQDVIRKCSQTFTNDHNMDNGADYVWSSYDFDLIRQCPTYNPENVIFVGDIHGEFDKLCNSLKPFGFRIDRTSIDYDDDSPLIVSVGDLVDRGPDSASVVRLFMNLVSRGKAVVVEGNHDINCGRNMLGENVGSGESKNTASILLKQPDSDDMSKFLTTLPRVVKVNVRGMTYIVSHAGVIYNNKNAPDSETVPNKYERDIIRHGLKNGGTINGRNDLFQIAEIGDNKNGPMQVSGHRNPSMPFVAPYFNGNTVNLESGAERGGDICIWVPP